MFSRINKPSSAGPLSGGGGKREEGRRKEEGKGGGGREEERGRRREKRRKGIGRGAVRDGGRRERQIKDHNHEDDV